MPTAHRRAFEGHYRQSLSKTFQRRIAARPTDSVEKHVGKSGCRHEFALAQAVEEDTMLISAHTGCRECALKPFAHELRNLWGAEMAQEHELAIADRARDAHKHVIVL